MVTQDTRLFGATVRDNIAMLDPRCRSIASRPPRASRNPHDVMELPMGYDTLLADGGASLSAAAPALALSRALLMDPVVMVLDEATSALDTGPSARSRRTQGAALHAS